MRRWLGSTTFVALAAFLWSASAAPAATVTDRPLLKTFDGSDTTAGHFLNINKLAVDNSNGDVYVSWQDRSGYVGGSTFFAVCKFNPGGTAATFSATETSCLTGSPGHLFAHQVAIAVDNSGGLGGPGEGEQGRLYVSSRINPESLQVFAPSGSPLCSFSPGISSWDVAVDPAGHPWVVPSDSGTVTEYANSGCPPAQIGSISLPNGGRAIDVDASNNVYISGAGGVEKYAGGAPPPSILDPVSAPDVYADQSSPSGHLFTVHPGSFNEYDSAETLLGTYGASYLGNGEAIAYNPSLDRVYAGDVASGAVEVFGPLTTGTVPNVTEVHATLSGEEISSAHFEGTVNPENVEAKAHFEWRKKGDAGWGGAKASPEVSLPVDSNLHTVEFETDELRGNTTYEVRLVTVNAADKLRAFSGVVEVTTKAAPGPPEVEEVEATEIETTEATVKGKVNPRGDTADWRVQLQRACEGSFTDQPLQTITHGSATPVPVSYTLKGLLPSETYCVRLKATNSADTTIKPESPEPPVEFMTLPIPPDQVVTAFAAPRSDTSARLNAYANPEGEALTYRFEYSKDGANWIALPLREDKSEARQPIVLAEELTGLNPATPYSYRFSAENAADAGSPVQGGEKAFTTRSEADIKALYPPSCSNEEVRANQGFGYLPQCRGIELVNDPDDGNQNVNAVVRQETPPLSADGERAIWNVHGGAPGGNSGAGATFLTKRTGPTESAPNGWQSRSLIPPAAKQIHAEDGSYGLLATTPDLSRFLFVPGEGSLFTETLVRIDENQNQEVLKSYDGPQHTSDYDLSADGAHVLHIDQDLTAAHIPEDQLEDIGIPGKPEVLSYLPNGSLPQCGVGDEGQGFTNDGPSGAGVQWRPGYHRMAATDASRAYFQIHPNGSNCGNTSTPWQIFERNREANDGEGETLEVAPPDPSNALIRATPDGRSVYFVTAGNCRKPRQVSPYDCEAVETADTNEHVDVYRWDEEAEEDSCLTCGVENEAGEAITDANLHTSGGAPRPVMVSDDFSHIYFESESRLTPQATQGQFNLYALSGGEISFVATPNNPDVLWRGGGNAELSSDGNVLVFATVEAGNHDLTADKLAASCSQPQGGSGPCPELFRYDDRERSLECLSCLRGGVTSVGFGATTNINGNTGFKLSADGETVTFVTSQALVARDVNNGRDLYEWRAGAQRLITDGKGSFQQGGFAALQPFALSASGRDILFRVTDPGLTGFEQNGLANLYDARIGGGFEPPPPQPVCEGEGCQGPLQAAPPIEQPGSTTIVGRGNVEEGEGKPRCAKGKVRRHGRCVKRHKHRHRRPPRRGAAHANPGRAK